MALRVNPSIVPEVFESARRQFGIAGGVLDVAVSEVLLDRPRILPVVGQFISGGVAEHVWVNLERDASLAPSPVDDFADCINGERSLALTDEHGPTSKSRLATSAHGSSQTPLFTTIQPSCPGWSRSTRRTAIAKRWP